MTEQDGNRPAPAVSVVLPTYNRASCLRQSMDSVLQQTFRNLELIVVDDASEDNTKAIVEGMSDPRIRYVRHESNRGGSAARNSGISMARGAFVAFQDSDDDWLPDKLERQMAAVDAECNVVYCGYTKRVAESETYVPDRRIVRRDGDILRPLLSANFVGTPTLVVRRSLLQEVGGFDESLGRFQDWELVIRLAAVSPFRLIDEPLVIARDTAGNISSNAPAGVAALRAILERQAALYERFPTAAFDALATLGHLECLSGEYDRARSSFRRALRIRPTSPKVLAALALSCLGRHAYRLGMAGRQWAERRSRSSGVPAVKREGL